MGKGIERVSQEAAMRHKPPIRDDKQAAGKAGSGESSKTRGLSKAYKVT